MLISFLNRSLHTVYPCYFGVIQMNQYEILDNHKINNYLSEWKANYKFIEMGQLRCIKIHAARLIDTIDDKKSISPALHQLLEASLVLETTDSKILAAYLKRPPAIIRSEFQSIRRILGECERNSISFY